MTAVALEQTILLTSGAAMWRGTREVVAVMQYMAKHQKGQLEHDVARLAVQGNQAGAMFFPDIAHVAQQLG